MIIIINSTININNYQALPTIRSVVYLQSAGATWDNMSSSGETTLTLKLLKHVNAAAKVGHRMFHTN